MILSSLVFLPLLFALLVMVWPKSNTVRHLALGLSVIEFLLSLAIFRQYDANSAGLQMVEQFMWIERFGIQYFMGIDGISLWLVLLTTFLTPIIILASWSSITERVKGFHAAMFVLQTAMIGTFLALDAVFFYVFWELSLVPMYFMVGIWGGARRIYATVKFFIYTFAGSVMMLVAIIYMMYLTQEATGQMSASLLDFYKLQIPFVGGTFFSLQTLLFFAFALAFAIKVPVFPLHTWLPDAHVEAPTPGSVILAGVMLKMGTYGFMRWVIPLFPEASEYWAWLFMLIGAVGIIYGALVAMVQPDVKKLVAYSSVSHMGYILLGLFAFNAYGMAGGLYQMLNHGISTGALFILIGMIYERTHSREISKYGGLASALPLFTIFFFIITLSSIAVPMTNGFVGEFLILLGTFQAQPEFAYFAVTGVVLGAVYMLWMFKRVFFGEKGELVADEHHPLHDLNAREIAVLVPLVVMVFWMGLFPNHFLDFSKASIDHLVNNRTNYNLTIVEPGTAASTQAAQGGN
ncbi:complex I subunit 4 family protein [Bdellovibrio reynosensis]|uniref:NADH-quinone oxidoreductase subunit M n=1 Tax=Bdellovibrio reynosensis TaxID=2835041 RepID=A0ABY4CE00_9BACT|nr:NADH-quinone oxidoreductase subunit M [Bdellovibrio reynosensis]UOF00430.1 NADH-quinone oxidoreductase subunit M [Bdellovibrio reynosensis]